MQLLSIKSARKIGVSDTLDLEVNHPDHNFYAEGIVTSNSHSLATSYLSALTVYLKYKYPVQFYWACLNNVKNLTDPLEEISAIQKELGHFGIKLLSPDILKGEFDYKIEGNDIRIGLSGLKNLSDKNLSKFTPETLRAFKNTVKNKFDLFLSINNAHLPLGVTTSLILSGAFDSISNTSRNRLVLEFEIWGELTPRELPIINSLGPKYNYDLPLIIKLASTELKNEKGKLHISEKRILTLRRDTADFFAKFHRNEKFSALTIYLAENYYLGFSYSHSLKSIYSKHINNLHDLKSLKALPPSAPRESYLSVVQIGEVEKRVSKNKKDYVKYTLKDDTDSLTVMDFQLDQRDGKTYKEGVIAVFHLTKKKLDSGDILYFVSDIIEQEVPTVLKVSTIRKELEEKNENNL
jgi:DNA polymerase III alpha subunit